MHDRLQRELALGWEHLARAGRAGPLDERTCCLLELAIAIGARDRDAVRAAHERALQLAAFAAEIEQIVALAAPTLGKPATLATLGWLGLDPAFGTPTGDAQAPSDA